MGCIQYVLYMAQNKKEMNKSVFVEGRVAWLVFCVMLLWCKTEAHGKTSQITFLGTILTKHLCTIQYIPLHILYFIICFSPFHICTAVLTCTSSLVLEQHPVLSFEIKSDALFFNRETVFFHENRVMLTTYVLFWQCWPLHFSFKIVCHAALHLLFLKYLGKADKYLARVSAWQQIKVFSDWYEQAGLRGSVTVKSISSLYASISV